MWKEERQSINDILWPQFLKNGKEFLHILLLIEFHFILISLSFIVLCSQHVLLNILIKFSFKMFHKNTYAPAHTTFTHREMVFTMITSLFLLLISIQEQHINVWWKHLHMDQLSLMEEKVNDTQAVGERRESTFQKLT